jgi:hypothetical protein
MTPDELNHVYSIRDLWHKLGLPGDPPRPGGKVCSPLRDDKHPSFAIFDDGFKARDFSLGVSYSAIDFFGAVKGIPQERQVAEYAAWLGQNGALVQAQNFQPGPTIEELGVFKAPSIDDCRAIAQARAIDAGAISLAGLWGTIKIGPVFGFASWVLTDAKKVVAEARRLDNQKYPAFGNLGERKSHTFKGSKKNWPVGLGVPQLGAVERILIVEGGPDYLAGVDLMVNYASSDAIVCAMLGGESLIRDIALVRLQTKIVRIMCHNDPAGYGAAGRWFHQLKNAGCQDVETVELEAPYSDLNDFMAKATSEEKTKTAAEIYAIPNP